MTKHLTERFISVDVEASGPIPGDYSLLTIGACDADQPDLNFECKLKPITRNFDPKALQVTGLSLDELENVGRPPKEAMEAFSNWLTDVCGTDKKPVFVGFNAPFDWSFVNYYFHRFNNANPFGITALDIKALYMGVTGCRWSETSSRHIAKRLHPRLSRDHNALHDALYQAELLRTIRSMSKGNEIEGQRWSGCPT